jgi:hypothetical protein
MDHHTLLPVVDHLFLLKRRKHRWGKAHKANHFYVFIVANPVTMLDNALAILRGGKTSSLNREMEKHYLSDPGIIRSRMNKQCPVPSVLSTFESYYFSYVH